MQKLIFLILPFLISCTTNTESVTVISTNNFIQTNYNYECLEGDKTFTEIILCYQKQDAAEKAQNNITNDLILNN